MQIDLDKLRRLEAKARREHLILMDLEESYRHAKIELVRQEIGHLRWIENNAPSYMEAVRRSGYDPAEYQQLLKEYGLTDDPPQRDAQGRIVSGGGPGLVEGLKDLWKVKCEAERLKAEMDAQSERWNGASTALAGLREFASKYGRRSSNAVAELKTPADAMARAQANMAHLAAGQAAAAAFDPAPAASSGTLPHFTVR